MADELKVSLRARKAATDFCDHALRNVCKEGLRDINFKDVLEHFAGFERDIAGGATIDNAERLVESVVFAAHSACFVTALRLGKDACGADYSQAVQEAVRLALTSEMTGITAG